MTVAQRRTAPLGQRTVRAGCVTLRSSARVRAVPQSTSTPPTPWVSYDRAGKAYQSALSIDAAQTLSGVLASTSTDDGANWSTPKTIVRDDNPTNFNDKDSITGDWTRAGYAYATWVRTAHPSENLSDTGLAHSFAFRGQPMLADYRWRADMVCARADDQPERLRAGQPDRRTARRHPGQRVRSSCQGVGQPAERPGIRRRAQVEGRRSGLVHAREDCESGHRAPHGSGHSESDVLRRDHSRGRLHTGYRGRPRHGRSISSRSPMCSARPSFAPRV